MGESFEHVKEGDLVTRMLGGEVPMRLRVSKVDETLIYCAFSCEEDAWTFDRKSGAEVDHDLRWGPQYGTTGSYLIGGDAVT